MPHSRSATVAAKVPRAVPIAAPPEDLVIQLSLRVVPTNPLFSKMLESKSWFPPLATKMNSGTKTIIILQMRTLRHREGPALGGGTAVTDVDASSGGR